MDNVQIAHDLAVSKLYGSDLETKELISMYRKYYDEILTELNSDSEPRKAKISNPIF